MNVERTIEFILNSQAKAEIRMDKFDRRLDSIAKLVRQGMIMLGKTNEHVAVLARSQREMQQDLKELVQSHKELAQSHKELAQSHKELLAAQKATDRSLKAFIDSMRSGRNGRSR